MVAKPLLHLVLSNRDQLANVLSGGLPQVDHDIRVNVRNLGVALAEPLQANLVDETAGANTLDFLEDRASAWMVLEPRMLATTPAEIFLHNAVHNRFVPPL